MILTGQYSYSDRGGDTNPSLSNPAINWRKIPHDLNKRGTNIKGADVQWGDGSTSKIFMPGTADTVYINLLAARFRSKLTYAYNGPVTLGAPIGGGVFHDTLKSPGAGDVVIKAVRGNDVTFAADQYYDGSTTIEKGATLRLGSGRPGGDGSLLTKAALFRVLNEGSLVVRNADKAITLSKISGTGSLTQAGAATTRLAGALTYTGTTTISRGVLALTGGSLTSSSAVTLTKSGAKLDLTKVGNQTLRNLSQASGTTVLYGDRATLTLSRQSKLSGTLQGGRLVNVGTTGGTFSVKGDFEQTPDGRLSTRATGTPVRVFGRVSLAGKLALTPPAKLTKETLLIANDGTDPIAGAFTNLPEGTRVASYQITYKGGDGNDVTLKPVKAKTALDQPTAHTTPPATTTTAADGFSLSLPATLAAAAVALLAFIVIVVRLRRRTSQGQSGDARPRPGGRRRGHGTGA